MEGSNDPVGVIGLGAIGSAFAERLLKAGRTVIGYDVSAEANRRLINLGGAVASSRAKLAESCKTVILSLPSARAMHEAAAAIAGVRQAGGVVIDTNTLAIEDKDAARIEVEAAGWELIDCTFAGNHDMVVGGNYAFFVSGGGDGISRADPVLALLSDRLIRVGAFGNASKIKFIINHLVMVHTAAAAEAMALAAKAGLDLKTVYDLVTQSSASSGIFELRGKMMVDEDYRSSRGNYHVIMKDAGVISDFAKAAAFPVPLFALATQLHMLGVAGGWADQDTASLATVFQQLASPADGGAR